MGRSATDLGGRLRRVLVMIPWLLDEGGSTVTELADRFGVSERDVMRDLNLVMCCGLPPYGGGDLITLVLDDDGTVEAWPGPFFSRPMRLTPAEGFAVLAAGRALQAVPGAGEAAALASYLEKLEAALGASGALAVDLDSPPLLAVVQHAARHGERLRVTYYSYYRDELSERIVEPLVVHTREGRWYAETRDVTDPATPLERRLRVDRLRSAVPTAETFVPPTPPPAAPEHLFSREGAVEVVLVVPPAAGWIGDAYASEEVEELEDGRLRVRLWSGGDRWLERVLLRAGPDAVVESPPELADLGARAARRLLAGYEPGAQR